MASAFAVFHSTYYYQLYTSSRFCLSLFLFIGVLKLLLLVRHQFSREKDWILGVVAAVSALAFSVAVADFSVDFSSNTIVLMAMALIYAVPMVFFYLHLRSSLFLIYHKVG